MVTGPPRQLHKGAVPPDSTKPISGIAVIGFAPVHDTMNEGAIGVLDSLGERVGGIEMVMPEKDQSSNQFRLLRTNVRVRR